MVRSPRLVRMIELYTKASNGNELLPPIRRPFAPARQSREHIGWKSIQHVLTAPARYVQLRPLGGGAIPERDESSRHERSQRSLWHESEGWN